MHKTEEEKSALFLKTSTNPNFKLLLVLKYSNMAAEGEFGLSGGQAETRN